MSVLKVTLPFAWRSSRITSQNFLGRSNRQFGHGSVKCSSSYEGDGKTVATILNHEVDSPLMIDGYHQHGFKLNNGMSVIGPVAIFPKTVLGWDVSSSEDITPESLALFTCLEPKLDILVIGVGDRGSQIPKETIHYLRKNKINMEILSTENACATFNYLNVEKRCVAGAIIPPKTVKYIDETTTRIRAQKAELYDMKTEG